MLFIYCPLCGVKLTERYLYGRRRKTCPSCSFIHYRNPLPAAAVIINQNSRTLLVKRKYEPKIGDWSLPAGYIEYDENPETAAIRETKEETGLDVSIVNLFDVQGACDDPDSRVILVIYEVEIVGGELEPGDDAIEAEFFPVNQLPDNIAFSSHKKALEKFFQI